jgi:hypothetical protein
VRKCAKKNYEDPEHYFTVFYTFQKPVLQSIEVNLMMLLNRFRLSEEIIANFGLYQIKYSQLKSLEREDLIKLGISDNKLQEDMLEVFQVLEGQDTTFNE